jgi:hypothetical protein
VRRKLILAAAVLLVVMAASAIVAAPDNPGGGLSIEWWTVDGGGGTSEGGSFALSGTAGQPDAGEMSGGAYVLRGGFWAVDVEVVERLYLPYFAR